MLIICLLSSPGDASVIKQISFSSYQPTEGLWEPKIIELLCFLRQGVWKVGPEREKEREKSAGEVGRGWAHQFSGTCDPE